MRGLYRFLSLFGIVVLLSACTNLDKNPQGLSSESSQQGAVNQATNSINGAYDQAVKREETRVANLPYNPAGLLKNPTPSPVSAEKAARAKGTYIHVDLKKQELHVFEDNALVMAMRVVIGREGRLTPTLDDRIVSLRFSPTWTPTPRLLDEDILPPIKKKLPSVDHAGLNKKYIIYYKGQKTRSENVNWATASSNNMYMVQRPGPKNALGGIRFSLTNSQAIYLHDTPSKWLFDKDDRSFSSGCIRVQSPKELARWIMEKGRVSSLIPQIDELFRLEKTRNVPLHREIPVYITR